MNGDGCSGPPERDERTWDKWGKRKHIPVLSDTASSFTAAQMTYRQSFLGKTQCCAVAAAYGASIYSSGYLDNTKRRAHGLEWLFFCPRFRPQIHLKSQSDISTLLSTATVGLKYCSQMLGYFRWG
ncbi:hypothetical protein B0H13DRAFT_1866565 [Mycena leptocephala]|nr:hypothetical protein B0H13DRAFT_1866565 [Mycena leptocephala]